MTTLPILILNLHTNCNCRCVMCDIWKRPDQRQFPAADLERHRESLRQLGVQQVVLTGGEPLLHAELEDILEFFRSCKVRITMLTTGLLLHKRAQLLQSSVDEIIISLDGPRAIHNEIRRIPRAFEVLERGVTTLRHLNRTIPIRARTTVQRVNHSHLRATVDAARALGLDSISFLPADLTSQAFNRDRTWTAERRSIVGLNRMELQSLEEEIDLLIRTHQADLQTHFIQENAAKLRQLVTRFREQLDGSQPTAPNCNAPWVSAVIEVDGSVRPCFFHPAVASTTYLSLEEAINSSPSRAFRGSLDVASNPTCQRCVCSLNYRA